MICSPGRAAATFDDPPAHREWIGLEGAPMWLNLSEKPAFGGNRPAPASLGGMGLVRLFRMADDRFYWTPIGFGLGGGAIGPGTLVAHLSSELGARLPDPGHGFEVGLGFGVGGVVIPYSTECDGTCWVGGLPIVVSPAVRVFLLEKASVSAALFARALVPVSLPNVLNQQRHGFGMVLMIGGEIALRR